MSAPDPDHAGSPSVPQPGVDKGELKPYVPASTNMAEMTVLSVGLGILLTLVFGVVNAYLGIKIGLTVGASIPAAVLSMVILRGVLRRGTILENNIVQTIGSSGESLAAGVVFTIPAFYFVKTAKLPFPSFVQIFLMAAVGGLLGVLIMVPLRRYLMVDEHKTLPFPEGTACAKVLAAGQEGGKKAWFVINGGIIGAVLGFFTGGLKLWNPTPHWTLAGSVMKKATLSFELTPLMLGVGYLIGPRIASIMMAGGLLGWVVLIPLIQYFGDALSLPVYPGSTLIAKMKPFEIWNSYVRYIGAGGVAIGGLLSIVKSGPTIFRSFKGSLKGFAKAAGSTGDSERPRTDRDAPLSWVGIGVAILVVTLILPILKTGGAVGIIAILLFTFFFVAVSARMVGLVGSTSQPVSGMTITVLLATSFLFVQLGLKGAAGMTAALTVGAVCCMAICMSGDISQDLKTGALVGATPWKQQVGEVIGTLTFALVSGLVVVFLYKVSLKGDFAFNAPQSRLMATLVDGVMGGQLPWTLIFVGVGIGLAVELAGVPALPLAIGLYLPLETSGAVIFGGLLAWVVGRVVKRDEREARHERGTLFSSGMVAGAALIGALMAGFAIIPWAEVPIEKKAARKAAKAPEKKAAPIAKAAGTARSKALKAPKVAPTAKQKPAPTATAAPTGKKAATPGSKATAGAMKGPTSPVAPAAKAKKKPAPPAGAGKKQPATATKKAKKKTTRTMSFAELLAKVGKSKAFKSRPLSWFKTRTAAVAFYTMLVLLMLWLILRGRVETAKEKGEGEG